MIYCINKFSNDKCLYFWARRFGGVLFFPMRMNEKCVAAKFHSVISLWLA